MLILCFYTISTWITFKGWHFFLPSSWDTFHYKVSVVSFCIDTSPIARLLVNINIILIVNIINCFYTHGNKKRIGIFIL